MSKIKEGDEVLVKAVVAHILLDGRIMVRFATKKAYGQIHCVPRSLVRRPTKRGAKNAKA